MGRPVGAVARPRRTASGGAAPTERAPPAASAPRWSATARDGLSGGRRGPPRAHAGIRPARVGVDSIQPGLVRRPGIALQPPAVLLGRPAGAPRVQPLRPGARLAGRCSPDPALGDGGPGPPAARRPAPEGAIPLE